MKVKVHVSAEDIELGRQSSPNSCPISLACKRALKTSEYVGVTTLYIAYNKQDLHIPRSAKKFVLSFDKLGPEAVKPFSFILDTNRKRDQ